MSDFFSEYIDYTSDTEAPKIFHRWAAISAVGALLGRNFFIPHGHFTVYPNMYCMLLGVPATRKSTAIKIAKKLMRLAGYTSFAVDKTTKEKFILDLAGQDFDPTTKETSILDENLWGPTDEDLASQVVEMYVMADEFNDFFGNNILDFAAFLGNLWDYTGVFENKVKNSSSVKIPNPTISILGGNTPTGFSAAFPPEIIGQGFFSRLLLIYAEPTGKRITFPKEPPAEQTTHLVRRMMDIRATILGKASLTPGAEKLLDKIYTEWKGIDDVRFDSYCNRRLNHLLKLCLIHAAVKAETCMTEDTVIYAHTVLCQAEHFMPKALGEFGKAKYADTSHKVISIIEQNLDRITTIKEIWKKVHNDLESMNQLSEILRKLLAAEKIQSFKTGFLPNKKPLTQYLEGTVDFSLLTEDERSF
jgi:hypothetical protein